jgi:hypothetical protein
MSWRFYCGLSGHLDGESSVLPVPQDSVSVSSATAQHRLRFVASYVHGAKRTLDRTTAN